MIKYFLLIITFGLIFLLNPNANAAYLTKNKYYPISNCSSYSINSKPKTGLSLRSESENELSLNSLLHPRGIENKDAIKSFLFGMVCVFPVLSFLLAPFCYYYGIRSFKRNRISKGFAIFGMTIATLSIIVSIVLLTGMWPT